MELIGGAAVLGLRLAFWLACFALNAGAYSRDIAIVLGCRSRSASLARALRLSRHRFCFSALVRATRDPSGYVTI